MEKKTSILVSVVLFLTAGLIYLHYELYAPYCAKHVCCSSTGGWWSLATPLCSILVVIGIVILVTDVIFE